MLLEEVSGSSGPLRSLRQVGWPLRPKEVLALWHDQLSSATGTNVSVTPFVLEGMFCSAASLAGVVKEYITKGRGMPQVEQALLTVSERLSCVCGGGAARHHGCEGHRRTVP